MDIEKVYFWTGLISEAVFVVGFVIYTLIRLYNRTKRRNNRHRDNYHLLRQRYYEVVTEVEKLKRFVKYVPVDDDEENE
jgi:hypothetical protein